jgi:hypothetical protein
VDVSRQFYFNIEPKQAKQNKKEATLNKAWGNLVRQINQNEITYEQALKTYKKLTTDVPSLNERKLEMQKYITEQIQDAIRLGVKGDVLIATLKGYGIKLKKGDIEALGKGGMLPIPKIPEKYLSKRKESAVL